MNAGPKINLGRFAPDTPLLTAGQVEQWKAELRALLEKRRELDQQIEAKEQLLASAAPLMAFAQRAAIEEAASRATPLPSPPPHIQNGDPFGQGAPRTEANLSAFRIIRDVAMKLAKEQPEGFKAGVIWRVIKADPAVSQRVKDTNSNYVYTVLKRLVADKVLARVGTAKYVLYERVAHLSGAGPIVVDQTLEGEFAGFKVVPMSKEERIRKEAAKYLHRRPNHTAHRTQIVDHLITHEIMGGEKSSVKTLSVYFARWPEFVSVGDGNYQLQEPEKTNGGD